MSETKPPAECPVSKEARDVFVEEAQKKPTPEREVYNVYSQRINPDNMMPMQPNQLPVPGQEAPLPQARVMSSIPKGGTEETWTYPSPQQFYNSLVRKRKKGEDLTAENVEMVVAIHNNMNEHGWAEVRRWEALETAMGAKGEPALLKFKGRPHDLSPWARVRSWLGYGMPFDRHDWIVERDGVRRRYILDYYRAETPEALSKFGSVAKERQGDTLLVLDVRPALDSFGAVRARAHAAFSRLFGLDNGFRVGGWSSPPDVKTSAATHVLPRKEPPERLRVDNKDEFERLSTLDAPRLRMLSRRFDTECATHLDRVKAAADGKEAQLAQTGFRLCMANIVCPEKATLFQTLLNDQSVDGADVDRAFDAMDACVERFALAASQQLANEATALAREQK